jgi:hypothetical protein
LTMASTSSRVMSARTTSMRGWGLTSNMARAVYLDLKLAVGAADKSTMPRSC